LFGTSGAVVRALRLVFHPREPLSGERSCCVDDGGSPPSTVRTRVRIRVVIIKRHPALIPLSRDHHDGLVQALRLRRAAADGDASARLAAAREFVEFFRNEERVHLRDEEEELFPLFLRHVPSQPAPLREARVQHVQLEGFARKLDIAVAAGIVDRETLDAAGELFDAHIRLEERQLFPLIEELVPDDELRRLGLASRDVTCAVRRPPLTS